MGFLKVVRSENGEKNEDLWKKLDENVTVDLWGMVSCFVMAFVAISMIEYPFAGDLLFVLGPCMGIILGSLLHSFYYVFLVDIGREDLVPKWGTSRIKIICCSCAYNAYFNFTTDCALRFLIKDPHPTVAIILYNCVVAVSPILLFFALLLLVVFIHFRSSGRILVNATKINHLAFGYN